MSIVGQYPALDSDRSNDLKRLPEDLSQRISIKVWLFQIDIGATFGTLFGLWFDPREAASAKNDQVLHAICRVCSLPCQGKGVCRQV